MNLFVNFFEGCNERLMGKETEGRGSTVKWGETPLERGGEGVVKSHEILLELWSYGNCGIRVGKYLMHARLDYWVCHKTGEIHFLGISCSTFSLFTFHLENSTLSAHVKPSLENNSINLLISIGVVIKITVYIYSIKFNFIKALFFICILVYCSLPTTN